MAMEVGQNHLLDPFSWVFRKESDRACAVLGTALLEESLKRLYERRLSCLQKEVLDDSLDTFYKRAKVARALAWISEDVYRDLKLIGGIRNTFAHKADHELSFRDRRVADKYRALKVAQVLIDANKSLESKPGFGLSKGAIRAIAEAIYLPPRKRFEITVEMLAQHLDELPSLTADYSGPDLNKELWDLGSQSI